MINYLLRILLAAAIGYCTNFIAIKMLFRPKKERRIGKFRVPFTPGIIPKNKPRIANAIGKAVASELLTTDDLKNKLLSEDIQNSITNRLISKINNDKLSIKENAYKIVGIEKYENITIKITDIICSKVIDGISEIDVTDILNEEIVPVIKKKIQSNMMLAMFVKDSMIQSFIQPIGEKISEYINCNGEEKIRPYIEKQVEEINNKSGKDILNDFCITDDLLEKIFRNIYSDIIISKISNVLEKINISKLVEDKINKMNVDEIEQLVMSVMKNELKAIVNLGALIGAVIGILNIFI